MVMPDLYSDSISAVTKIDAAITELNRAKEMISLKFNNDDPWLPLRDAKSLIDEAQGLISPHGDERQY